MKFLMMATIWTSLLFSGIAFASPIYKGESLNCTGPDVQISINTTDGTLTRNGVVYHEILFNSFAFFYFKVYDKANALQEWTLSVFDLGDDTNPGKSFVGFEGEGNQKLISCKIVN